MKTMVWEDEREYDKWLDLTIVNINCCAHWKTDTFCWSLTVYDSLNVNKSNDVSDEPFHSFDHDDLQLIHRFHIRLEMNRWD